MNKEEFLNALRARLDYLPREDVERALAFYAEGIDDRVEDGMSESEAVAAMGDIDAVVHAIEAEMPLSTIVRQRVKSSRERSEQSGGGHSAWWIVLAVLGSPVWLTFLCLLGGLVVTVYAVVWVLVVSLFAVLLALGLSSLFMLIYAVSRLIAAGLAAALICFGIALATAGAAAALLWPCVLLTRLLVKLPQRCWRWVKGLFIGGRRNDL